MIDRNIRKYFIAMLLISVIVLFALNGNSKAEDPSYKAKAPIETGSSETNLFNVRNFRNPFATWLPKQKAPEKPETKPETTPVGTISPPVFSIQGLIWNSDLPQAIVDNQVVKIGDVVNGAEILKIDKEGITVKYSGKEFLIKPQVNIQGAGNLKGPDDLNRRYRR